MQESINRERTNVTWWRKYSKLCLRWFDHVRRRPIEAVVKSFKPAEDSLKIIGKGRVGNQEKSKLERFED